MTRALIALAAAFCLAASSGCGEDSEAAPQGSPAERHGAEAVGTVEAAEQVRARLVAASDLYGVREGDDARAHLAVADERYRALSERVAAADARLDEEIRAAFRRIDTLMERRSSFDEMRDLMGPLSDQLLGGALAELVDDEARGDRGLEAEVARRLVLQMSDAFAEGSSAGPDGRLSLQYSYGLLDRSIRISRGLSETLGPQKDDVSDPLARLRDTSFPDGVGTPEPQPAAEVVDAARGVAAALARRYGLDG